MSARPALPAWLVVAPRPLSVPICVTAGCDCECDDAVSVLLHWVNSHGAPYVVSCQDCEWREDWEWDDGRSDQFSYDAAGICRTCGGSGWKRCTTLEESPWVIDSFTHTLARIDSMFLRQAPDEGGDCASHSWTA